MAEKAKATKVAEDQNPGGASFDAKAMLLENSEKQTVIKYSDRLTVKLLKDTIYQKAGKVYSPHKVKALALVEQGLAELVK